MSINPHKICKSIVDDVATIILAGGQGTRLYPLTKNRCKPAVSFGGRYKLIDIPISNSLNSGISSIYVISQYFSSGLNNHIMNTFKFDDIQGGYIHCLHPDESEVGKHWYHGTADAVRKNIAVFKECNCNYFLILSGDQLYNMNLFQMIAFSKEKNSDLTIATLPVKEEEAKRMGLLKINETNDILDFVEKPQDPKILKNYRLSKQELKKTHLQDINEHYYLGSMGIYLFKKEVLIEMLEKLPSEDFGKHIIPQKINEGSCSAFFYDGYWEDIGTISSYYKANLALTRNSLGLDLYNEALPIFAGKVNLPSARICHSKLEHSIISQGSVIEASEISHSLLGLRCLVKKESVIKNSILIGNQFYTPPQSLKNVLPPQFSIGTNSFINNAIIDEHVFIGNNVKLTNEKNIQHFDGNGIYIRDGIIIVTSGTSIPDNFVL